MKNLSKKFVNKENRKIKVIQFGEGNFLRAFQDYFIDILNEKTDFNGNIVIIKPRQGGSLEKFVNQDFLYTVNLTSETGEEMRIITSIQDAISPYNDFEKYIELSHNPDLKIAFSNTTESGIEFIPEDIKDIPLSFPGKVTAFLYERFKYFNKDTEKGIYFFPSELIDNNGDELLKAINQYISYWNLEDNFKLWVNNYCHFYNTLVDRIVSGFPNDKKDIIFKELGYEDNLLVSGEEFGLWVIEGEKEVSDLFNLDSVNLPILLTDDIKKYKKRKVRILNGAHTSIAALSYLLGYDYVKDALNDKDISMFLDKLFQNEIIPTLTDVDDPLSFSKEVIKRFRNPYINHKLLDISLNSFSKWETRCLPSVLDYLKEFNKLPKLLPFGLASIICLYKNVDDNNYSSFKDRTYIVQESKEKLDYFRNKNDIIGILESSIFFKHDLSSIPGLKDTIISYLNSIEKIGLRETLWEILK